MVCGPDSNPGGQVASTASRAEGLMDSAPRLYPARNQSPVLGDKTLPVRRNGEVTAGLLTLDNGQGDRTDRVEETPTAISESSPRTNLGEGPPYALNNKSPSAHQGTDILAEGEGARGGEGGEG